MSTLILFAAAAVWFAAHQQRQSGLIRVAAGIQIAGAVLMLVTRGTLLPTGWAGAAVLATCIPAALLAWRPKLPITTQVVPSQAVLALIAAVWSATLAGPDLVGWAGWAIPHVLLAVLGVGAAAAVALLALIRLRGQAIGLLAGALLITALPLAGTKASAVTVYADGEPATVSVALADPAGAQGAQITLPARAALPGEGPLRMLAVLVLAIALMTAIVRRVAHTTPTHRWTERAALVGVGLHVLLLFSAAIPRDLGVTADDLTAQASATVQRDGQLGERAGDIKTPDGPYNGGPAAPALPLTLALTALGLCFVAHRPPAEHSPQRDALEGRLALMATLLLAAAAATGMVWSNFVWGGPALADPKLYAMIVVLGLYGLYFLAQRDLPGSTDTPSWLALAAFAVLMLSMLGPELGWIAPTLHHFGA